jgi:hypothetical protein
LISKENLLLRYPLVLPLIGLRLCLCKACTLLW